MAALYRKYRPKSLEEVLGQETITTIIKNSAKADRLAHAYLFFGGRGSGKTTTARIVAKIANCHKRAKDVEFKKLGEPCNECQSCLEIDRGQSLDVIEIDAASNRGIDEIRNLKEGIRLSPSSSFYKVFIIDEVHQLTKEAFNALLKTLEEPPAHAILILATTEFEKVPSTISSRAQRFHFKKATLGDIVLNLKNILTTEKIKFNEPALELIGAASDGSFRDAISLLDQVINMEGKVEEQSVEKVLGKVGFSRVSKLAQFLIDENIDEALKYLNSLEEEGFNIVQFNKDLINYFRKVLALRFSPELEIEYKKITTESDLEILKSQSKKMQAEKIIKLEKSLIQAYTEMRYSPFAIVPLEVAIIENLKK